MRNGKMNSLYVHNIQVNIHEEEEKKKTQLDTQDFADRERRELQ